MPKRSNPNPMRQSLPFWNYLARQLEIGIDQRLG
jgi:hypothetical protein